MINFDNVSFRYSNTQILQNLTFEIKKGEIVSLIGASGSGKTTIFKLLSGLINPQDGVIHINGTPLSSCRNQIAYMMQEDLLLPWRNVFQNLLLVSEFGKSGSTSSNFKEAARELLTEMGLGHCEKMYPDQLSGGMRQRVSLIRSLLQKRPILLLDEPFGALDLALREQFYTLLSSIQSQKNLTIILVTHDFNDALSLSDRIFLLSKGKISHTWVNSHNERDYQSLRIELRKQLIKNHI